MTNKERIIQYYKDLDRSYFIDDHKEYAHMDTPLPIGYEQTISQPSLVLQMTILLDPREDSRVLEIGTGSGYQTALLAQASKEIYTIERIEELQLKAKERLLEADYTNIHYKLGDGSQGWEEHGPYDRIMVTAGAHRLPDKLVEQLAPEGKMIIPIEGDISQELTLVKKDLDGEITREVIDYVRFVKLIGDY